MHDCKVCGKADPEKPMCFRGEDYCSELHRKVLAGVFGNNLGDLFIQGLITQTEAERMSSTTRMPIKISEELGKKVNENSVVE